MFLKIHLLQNERKRTVVAIPTIFLYVFVWASRKNTMEKTETCTKSPQYLVRNVTYNRLDDKKTNDAWSKVQLQDIYGAKHTLRIP